ncbi:MAG: hypothetical protein O2779_00195 [Nanoarchaeota archaeon]|nr:hypothetical protein [Nanoarchaeota archaeon]
MKEFFRKNRWLMVLVVLMFFYLGYTGFFRLNHINHHGERGFYLTMGSFIQEAVREGFFPHWIPYYFGGTPFFGQAQNMVFRPFTLFSSFVSVAAAFNLEKMLLMIMGGIAMFYYLRKIKIQDKFAVIGSLVFLFSAFPLQNTLTLGDEMLLAYYYVPVVFLFLAHALASRLMRERVFWSMLIGVAFVLQFNQGYPPIFFYTAFLFGVYLMVHVLSKLSTSVLVRVVTIGFVAVIVCVGLGAVKILPVLDFGEHSSLSSGRSLEGARDSYLVLEKASDYWVHPFLVLGAIGPVYLGSADQVAIGYVALFLVFCSLIAWRKRSVMLGWVMLVLLFVAASGGSLFYLLWKFFPGFNRGHHIARILYLVGFPAGILAAQGAQSLFSYLSSRISLFKQKKVILGVFVVLVLGLLLNVGYFTARADYDTQEPYTYESMLEDNALFSYLSEQKGVFRIHNLETTWIGAPASVYGIPYKQQVVWGAINVWVPSYVNEYLLGAGGYNPLKFYQMLNTRYFYSSKKVNDSRLELVDTYEVCGACEFVFPGDPEYGPYLYELTDWLPRAYAVSHPIVVYGKENDAKQLMYSLMVQDSFDPTSMVIILGGEHPSSNALIEHAEVIFLAGSTLSELDIDVLRIFVERGGVLLPDVLQGKTALGTDEVVSFLKGLSPGLVTPFDILDYTPNGYTVDSSRYSGIVVLAEQFSQFPEWRASGEQTLYRANGVGSALIVADEEVVLYYSSDSFRKGVWISIVTLLFVLGYVFWYVRSFKYKRD